MAIDTGPYQSTGPHQDTETYQEKATRSREGRVASDDALAALEDALASGSPGRESAWLDRVLEALAVLARSLDQQMFSDQTDHSLLEEIRRDHPRFAGRIDHLHQEQEAMRTEVDMLHAELNARERAVNVASVRNRLAELGRRYRHHRARAADLVLEAVNVDLGVGD